MLKKMFIPAFLVLIIPSAAAAYDLYVQSIKAPVYFMPDTASGIITTYEKGSRLTGIESKDNWHMIRINDGTGWVYRFLVGDRPPPDPGQADDLVNHYTDYSDKARRRPSSYTAAAAARGLRDKRRRFAEKYHLDYEALKKIEGMRIPESEVLSFIKQGLENDSFEDSR